MVLKFEANQNLRLHNVQGLYCYSMVNVPLYDSLGPEARAFVISECEMRIIVAFDEVC